MSTKIIKTWAIIVPIKYFKKTHLLRFLPYEFSWCAIVLLWSRRGRRISAHFQLWNRTVFSSVQCRSFPACGSKKGRRRQKVWTSLAARTRLNFYLNVKTVRNTDVSWASCSHKVRTLTIRSEDEVECVIWVLLDSNENFCISGKLRFEVQRLIKLERLSFCCCILFWKGFSQRIFILLNL